MSQTSAILEHNAFCPADAAMPTSLPSTPRIAEKLGEAAICHICHSLRWTRIKDVNNRETGFGPREFRFIWKEWIQWAQRLASSHTWNAKFLNLITDFPSVQLRLTLRPRGLQHARPPCSSPTPGVDSNLCPFSRWCDPTITFSVVPFSSCLQSFPASGSFQMSQFFTSGGQSMGVSASASVLPMNIQDWFPLGRAVGSPCSPRDSQESSTPQFKSISSSTVSFLYSSTLTSIHEHWKSHSFN